MADSPLDIFADESIPPGDPTVARGIGAIGALAVVIAATIMIFGIVVVGAVVGVVFLATRSAQVDVVAFTQLSCRLTAHDVVVSTTIAQGPDFASDFVVRLGGWEPETLYFDSDQSDDDPSLVPGSQVSFSGPADRADEITGVRMGVWRGEPGYAQTIPLTVQVNDGGCVAATEPRN